MLTNFLSAICKKLLDDKIKLLRFVIIHDLGLCFSMFVAPFKVC